MRGLVRVRADQLHANAANWRMHPPAQRSALVATIDRIGFSSALIAALQVPPCEAHAGTPERCLTVIDGHLRRDVAGSTELPVLVVDLDEQEAKLLLATLDPLAAMATANEEAYHALLESLGGEGDAIAALLAGLDRQYGIPVVSPLDGDQPRLDQRPTVTCPECGHEFAPAPR